MYWNAAPMKFWRPRSFSDSGQRSLVCLLSTFSKGFSSETTEHISVKIHMQHPGKVGCGRGGEEREREYLFPCHITKVAAMPRYVKNLKTSLELLGGLPWNSLYSNCESSIKMYIYKIILVWAWLLFGEVKFGPLDLWKEKADPELTLTSFSATSNLFPQLVEGQIWSVKLLNEKSWSWVDLDLCFRQGQFCSLRLLNGKGWKLHFSDVFWCYSALWYRGGRVVRWFWVNFQCRGVLQFWW